MREAPRDNSKSVTAWVAIVISIAGLIGTNIWSYTQFDHQDQQISAQKAALSAQQAALSQAQEQFKEAHGSLSITSIVMALDRSTQLWTTSQEEDGKYRGQTLNADFFNLHDTYVRIQVVNSGTGATQVTFAGILLNNSGTTYGNTVRCAPTEAGGKLSDCTFPMKIDAQATAYIYVLTNDLTDAMACNNFIATRGLVGGIKNIGGELLTDATGTQVDWSNYCPTPTPIPSATETPNSTATATPGAPTEITSATPTD